MRSVNPYQHWTMKESVLRAIKAIEGVLNRMVVRERTTCFVRSLSSVETGACVLVECVV